MRTTRLFLEDGVNLGSKTRQDYDRCKGDTPKTVDDTFIPLIRIFHCATQHKDHSQCNQPNPNSHIHVIVFRKKQRKTGLRLYKCSSLRCTDNWFIGSDFLFDRFWILTHIVYIIKAKDIFIQGIDRLLMIN